MSRPDDTGPCRSRDRRPNEVSRVIGVEMPRPWSFPSVTRQYGLDFLAGLIVATVAVAYCVGFAAVIFEGDLAEGAPLGVWSMLVGTAITCIFVSLITSVPPMIATQEAIGVGMLKVVSVGIVASSQAMGLSVGQTITNVMAGLILSSLVAGAAQLLVGMSGAGKMLRFIPSAVTGGFLCATGLVIWDASFRMVTGVGLGGIFARPAFDFETAVRLAVAFGFFASLLGLRRWTKSPLLLPYAFIATTLLVLVIQRFGAFAGGLDDWFPAGTYRMSPWFPIAPDAMAKVNWDVIVENLASIAAVPFVLIVSLAVRTAAFEDAFNRTANFDTEFKSHGLAAIVTGMTGGTMAAAAQGSVRLLHEFGARSAVPSMTAAGVIALVLMTGIDLTAIFPLPLLSGLLLIIGWGIVIAALGPPLKQKAWGELGVIVLIVAVSLNVGFFAAVVVGFGVSSALFVLKYSQVPIIRRQMTRCTFSSHVARSASDEKILRESGDAIRIYWLSGYLFFGSSHRVVAQIRKDVELQKAPRVAYLVIDFSGVTGVDSAAVKSLNQLARHCATEKITIVCSGLSTTMREALHGSHLVESPDLPAAFANHNDALAWCEEKTLDTAGKPETDRDFAEWVAQEIGCSDSVKDFLEYLQVRSLPAETPLYTEGTPADTIDIIAGGKVAIVVTVGGRQIEVRRMEQHTIVGEMGFFRRQMRSASVVAIGPVTIYQLDRESFERMKMADPAMARALMEFLIKTLSDRLEFANGAIRELVEPLR